MDESDPQKDPSQASSESSPSAKKKPKKAAKKTASKKAKKTPKKRAGKKTTSKRAAKKKASKASPSEPEVTSEKTQSDSEAESKAKAAANSPSPAESESESPPKTDSKPEPASEEASEPKSPPEPEPKPAPKGPPKPVAELDEVLATLTEVYPRAKRPSSVAYFLSPEWRRNLERRLQAEQGVRFFEGITDRIREETGLDLQERMSLVDRPAFLLKILLHPRKRFAGPSLEDRFLRNLGGEARLLDLWVSALGPYYYARGYRVRPQLEVELNGSPPPLDRDDPVARKAMKVAARELKKLGFRRVPGKVAREPLKDIFLPSSFEGDPADVFDALFGLSGADPNASAPPEPEAPPPRRPPRGAEPPPDRLDPTSQIELEMELFQRELEDEIEAIQEEIEKTRRRD